MLPARSPGPERRRQLSLAIQLTLGFAAIALVLFAGNWAARVNTRYAIETLRDAQFERVPFARLAAEIGDRLVVLDRAVLARFRDDSELARAAVAAAQSDLEQAVQGYVEERPDDTPGAEAFLDELREHVAAGEALTAIGDEREQTLADYRRVLEALSRRVTATFKANAELADHGMARRSFAEIELAAGELRDSFNDYIAARDEASVAAMARAESGLGDTVDRHRSELQRSPGHAWIELVDEDAATITRLRKRFVALDAEITTMLESFSISGRRLPEQLDARIASPARLAVSDSAGSAAAATESAERTFRTLTIVVLGVTLAVSLFTILAVTRPVRRLILASRAFARGSWDTRVPTGGPRELDELAGAFNHMAEQVSAAHAELEQHRSALEARVKARTRKLNHLAYHDTLTGLPNRRYGFTHLRRLMRKARTTGTPVGLLALDVDGFKIINDNLGHALGDLLLRSIAERLRTLMDPHHFVARLGGDEFIVIADGAHACAELEELAARLIDRFREPVPLGDRDVLVSVSIGVALHPQDAGDVEALARAADAALFRAKSLGRNRIATFSPELLDGREARFATEQALRHALESNALEVHYQPQVDLASGVTGSVEALVRWRRDDGALAAAGEFIEIAEQTGLIIPLGDWVLDTALQAAAGWRADGLPDMRVAVNVSAQQLLDNAFIERVEAALERNGVPPAALELELTESAFQTGPATVAALRRARELGIAIALDDFGTGYSSFTSLAKLPIDRVKLDRSLIADIATNARTAAIVRSIMTVCHSLGLDVTVEGVEDGVQLDFLAPRAGLAIQGYLFSKAIPREDVLPYTRTSAQSLRDARTSQPAGQSSAASDSVVRFRLQPDTQRRQGA